MWGVFLLLLLKPAAQAQVGRIVYKLLSHPTSTNAKENCKTAQGNNQRLTAPLNPSNDPVSSTMYGRFFSTRVWAGSKHLSNSDVLHLDTSNFNGCSSGMSNPDRSRWKLTEQTMIRVRIILVKHTQCSNMTSITQRQETLIKAKPCHRIHLAPDKLKMTFSSSPPHRRTTLKHWENKYIVYINEATQRCPQRHASPTSTYQFFERPRTWSSKVSLLSNFTPKMSRLH